MERISLTLAGMSCGHCVAAVRGALQTLDGVEVEQVEIGSASVSFDPSRVGAEQIARVVEEGGYTVKRERRHA
jgi:copper chaperone